MIAGPGGFQAEATFYVNGLDIDAKIEMLRNDVEPHHILTCVLASSTPVAGLHSVTASLS